MRTARTGIRQALSPSLNLAGQLTLSKVMGPLRDPNPRGTLWLYSPHETVQAEAGSIFNAKTPSASPAKPVELTLEGYPEGHDFHPLGVKVYPSYGRNASNVYVVNHARHHSVIEQFVLSPDAPTSIRHVRTLESPSFVSPNALALTSPDSFYVTNDHLFTRRFSGLFAIIETLLGLPFSYTEHVVLDSSPFTTQPVFSTEKVATLVAFSNGISISANGTLVAIASTSLSRVHFYTRDLTTNALAPKTTVSLPFVPDNIDFDDEDNLIVAGHPHFPTLTKVVTGEAPYAPGWVISVTLGEGHGRTKWDADAPVSASSLIPAPKNAKLRTLLQTDGQLICATTTGLYDNHSGELYVAGLYASPGVIVCKP